VGEPVLFDRVPERPRHVRLADEIVERLRTIFSRENLVAHAPNLIRFNPARKQKSKKRDRITELTGNKRFFIRRWTLDVGRWTFSLHHENQSATPYRSRHHSTAAGS
jgi:hypothetical protein